MLHLLPEYQKKKVLAEYRLRLVVVLILMLVFAIIAFAIFLMPSYVYLFAAKSDLVAKKSGLESTIASKSGIKTNQNGGDVSKSIAALKPLSGSLSPLAYMDQLMPTSPSIRVNGYFMATTNNGKVGIVITGNAETRESLSAYANALNAKFGGVKLPLSALAKQGNIPFDFRFEVDQAKLDKPGSASGTGSASSSSGTAL